MNPKVRMSKFKLILVTILLELISIARGSDLAGLDDNEIIFKINWPDKGTAELLKTQSNAEPYLITTASNEKYQCFIPDTTPQKNAYTQQFKDVDPMDFLQPLFDEDTCNFKLDSYWTYEVCHGRHVRQYHEDREPKKPKVQEYYLGTFDKDKHRAGRMEKWFKELYLQAGPPVKEINGNQMPYVEVEMTEGTICDLNGKPRTIKLLYVCYWHGKHDILSLEETSSCEYEAIILSPLLCTHPDYRPRGMGETEINCMALDNAPRKPRTLLALEDESRKFRNQKVKDEKMLKVHTILHIDKEGQVRALRLVSFNKDGETRVRVEIHPVDVLDKHNIDDSGSSLLDQGLGQSELSPVQSFLSGKNCLNGGNGWWKYEFCYGRSVVQYHIERDGTKTIVDLGKFDRAKHIAWIEAHPHKRLKRTAKRKQLSHFYSDGSVCDKTGKLRQTEVRLKCVESQTTSPSSVSLFLLEPKTCEYILGVESPLICDIVEFADINGLMSEDAALNFEDIKSFHQSNKNDDDLDERIANDDE